MHQCRLIATVEDGKLVRLRGNPDYPKPNKGCTNRMPHASSGCTAPSTSSIPSGFEQLRTRSPEYSGERVADITWVPADLIRVAPGT